MIEIFLFLILLRFSILKAYVDSKSLKLRMNEIKHLNGSTKIIKYKIKATLFSKNWMTYI